MEPGQPRKKRMRMDKEGRQDEKDKDGGRIERTEKQGKEILTTTPTKRKENQEKQKMERRGKGRNTKARNQPTNRSTPGMF